MQQMPTLEQSRAGRFAPHLALLQPFRRWLSEIEISDRTSARILCFLIPAQCPFEQTFRVFGHTVLSIPPLCKLNPFYNELVVLRFRSLCYLAEVVGDDISRFC
jgi:hypothetical protein